MLGQALPCSVTVAGETCPIDTDWRIGVQMESLLLDDSVEEEQKSLLVLNLYFLDFFKRPGFYLSHLEESLEACYRFYQGGQPSREHGQSSKRVYDFEQDEGLLAAAFLADYGIDLTAPDLKLHWHRFLALFSGLREEDTISRIMSIRAADTGKMKGEERDWYTRMQRKYAIRQKEDPLQAQVEQALLSGGDLSGIL